MKGRNKNWMLILCSAAALALAAGCGSDDGNTPPDGSGTDAGNDTSVGDAGNDSALPDVSVEDTDPGQDTDANIPTQCRRHLEACTDAASSNDQFACDTTIGLCVQRCVEADAETTEGANCPLGSFCFAGSGTAPTDPVTGDVLDGVCFPGDCDGSIFDADACEGIEANVAPGLICTAATCTCQPIANGASFCLPAGTADIGDPCGLDASDNPPASDTCAAGLLCILSECVQPCDLRSGDASCTGDAAASCADADNCTCEPVLDTTPRNQPGLCTAACDPFSADQCPDGQACVPQWGRFGLNAWVCGDVPAEPIAAGEGCNIDGGLFGQCVEGSICVSETTGGPGVCTPLCDPFGEASGALASCGGDAIGAILIDATAYGEASGYLNVPAASYPVDLRDTDGGLIAPTVVDVVEGEVHSVVATIADGALDLIVLDDYLDGDVLPASGVRALHAASTAGEVDLYLVGMTDEVLGACGATTETCVTDADCTAVVCEGAAEGVQGTCSGTADPCDLDTDCTQLTCDGYVASEETETELATSFAYGDVFGDATEASSYVPLAEGTYTLRLYAAGTDTLALELADIELGADVLATIIVTDGAEGPEYFVLVDDFTTPAATTGSARVIHAASSVGPVVVHLPGDSGEVCAPIAINGLGFCNTSCDPFPRTGGEYPECETNQACFPLTARDDEPSPIFGVCNDIEAGDTAAAFEGCTDPGFLGGGCDDFAVCLGDENDQNAVCLPLCEPFSEGPGCERGTCSGVPPILGQQNFSFCVEDAQDGLAFERCTEEGLPCSADMTLCLDITGNGPLCYPVCRQGGDDCAAWDEDGRSCVTGQLNASVVPPFMGLCQ